MGRAYYANYFRWFEVGRTELFRALGLAYAKVEARGVFLPVAEAHCKYVSPVNYDDVLEIETSVDKKVRAGFKFNYRLFKAGCKEKMATGFTKHACLDRNGKIIRPPGFLMSLIAE
jgi:acyl-CoA thioester hydrolase